MEGVGDDYGVDVVGEQGETVLECAENDDNSGGVVAGRDVLGLGELDKHLVGRMEDLHLVEDGGAVVVDDDLIRGWGDHIVHALGARLLLEVVMRSKLLIFNFQ